MTDAVDIKANISAYLDPLDESIDVNKHVSSAIDLPSKSVATEVDSSDASDLGGQWQQLIEVRVKWNRWRYNISSKWETVYA